MKSYNVNLQCTGDETEAQTRTAQLVQGLRAAGHTVHVATFTYGEATNLTGSGNSSIPAVAEPANVTTLPGLTEAKTEGAGAMASVETAQNGEVLPPVDTVKTNEVCPTCKGTGAKTPGVPCPDCGGTGEAKPSSEKKA